MAVILGLSDDYVRRVIVVLLNEGIFLPRLDLIELKPMSGTAEKSGNSFGSSEFIRKQG